MNKSFAHVTSYITHPLLMCTYLCAILYFFEPQILMSARHSNTVGTSILLVIWLTTFLIPALSVVTLKYTGIISSLTLNDRKERVIPFFFTSAFYAISAYMFSKEVTISTTISIIYIGAAILVLIGAIITTQWKISIHGLGIGCTTGFLTGLWLTQHSENLLYPLVFSVLLTGTVMTARLALNVHSAKQVYTGTILGSIVGITIVYFLT